MVIRHVKDLNERNIIAQIRQRSEGSMKMMHDEFEMENQGYEEECPSGNRGSLGSFEQVSSSLLGVSRSLPISHSKDRPSLRSDHEETHVYEDIAVSPSRSDDHAETVARLPVVESGDSSCRRDRFVDDCPEREDKETEDEVTTNFHRNLTLPLRGTIDREISADRANRYSVRVTNRERTRRPTNEDYHVTTDPNDPVRIDLEPREDEDEQPRGIDRLVDKPGGRRRRKKDCKRCNKSKVVSGLPDDFHSRTMSREASARSTLLVDPSGRIVHPKNAINEDKRRLDEAKLTNTFDSQLPPKLLGTLQAPRLSETRNNSIFAISKNVNTVTGSPKPINYDKNETDLLRLTPVELNDDRALITPQKNRNGMKVNSIYSQEHWRPKDLPIFFTDVKEQTFQRAYSLPTRTQTPTSQNRVNLRRSVRGEPPPHPARLRKSRHGWTLHFARPLDATGCTRSIVLLLIAVLALLGIGAIALYIVFEPEKLQIIQQYLRSSTPNVTGEETNATLVGDSLDLLAEEKFETTTLATLTSTTQLSENLRTLPRETTLPVEPEVELATTTAKIETTPNDRNVTRYCDDCYEGEACVALVDEEVPVCRVGPDRTDPTGCNGLCLINKQKCHRLDFDAFRCVEVEHYCLDDEWTCANTLCIPLVKHCDGHMNCYDHSDEYDCACDLQTHFQCGNETSCLPVERRCDGKIDCWDATDEMNCTLGQDFGWSCPSSSEFTCSNGECILKARFCDGLRDCTDGSDEPHGCQGRCNKHEFSCLNGRCITKGTKCNGIDDCGDGSDEQHCRDRIYKKVAA